MPQPSVVRGRIRLAHEQIGDRPCTTDQSRHRVVACAPTWVPVFEYGGCGEGGYGGGEFGVALVVEVDQGWGWAGLELAGGYDCRDAASNDGTDGEAGGVDKGRARHGTRKLELSCEHVRYDDNIQCALGVSDRNRIFIVQLGRNNVVLRGHAPNRKYISEIRRVARASTMPQPATKLVPRVTRDTCNLFQHPVWHVTGTLVRRHGQAEHRMHCILVPSYV